MEEPALSDGAVLHVEPGHSSQLAVSVAAGQLGHPQVVQVRGGEAAQALPDSLPPAPHHLRPVPQPHTAPPADSLQSLTGGQADDLLHLAGLDILHSNVGIADSPSNSSNICFTEFLTS